MRAFALLSAFAAVLAAPAASKRHHGNATIGGRGDLMTLATSDHWPCAVSESYKLTVTASKCFTTTELSKLYSATWPVSNAKFDSSKFSIKFESCPSSYGDDDDEAAPAVAAPLARPPQIEILKGKTKSSVAGAIVIRVCGPGLRRAGLGHRHHQHQQDELGADSIRAQPRGLPHARARRLVPREEPVPVLVPRGALEHQRCVLVPDRYDARGRRVQVPRLPS